MFVVAAERHIDRQKDDKNLQNFICRQIEAAKAPSKAHVLVRSGTGILQQPQDVLIENNGTTIQVTQARANPLSIGIKERSDGYLAADNSALNYTEPSLKRQEVTPNLASDYSVHRLGGNATDSYNQGSQCRQNAHVANLTQSAMMPQSARRWCVRRNPNGHRASSSLRMDTGTVARASGPELKTKEELIRHLERTEEWLTAILKQNLVGCDTFAQELK